MPHAHRANKLICLLLALALLVGSVGGSQAFTRTHLNPAHRLLWGLLAWWLVRPQQAGAATWPSVLEQYPVTLINMGAGSGWMPSTRPGSLGEMRFDGSNDYGTVANSASAFAFADQSFTVAFWFRTTSLATQQFLVAQQLTTSTQGGWLVRLETSGLLHVRILDVNNSSLVRRSSVTTLSVNTWYHVAVMFTTSTVAQASNEIGLYLNGVLNQSARTDGANPYTVCGCPVIMGIQGDGVNSPLSGAIDDMRIWNRGLSAAEIFEVSQQTAPRYGGMVVEPSLVFNALGVVVKRRSTMQ